MRNFFYLSTGCLIVIGALTGCGGNGQDTAQPASDAQSAAQPPSLPLATPPKTESAPANETASDTAQQEPQAESEAQQAAASGAQEHIVKAAATKFEPVVIFANPGDTITWTNMAGHDTVSLEGMIPDAASPWKSSLGENFSITLDIEGAYVYKCSPHVSLGMLGAIVVGKVPPANLSTIEEALKTTKEPKGMVKRTVKKLKQAIAQRG